MKELLVGVIRKKRDESDSPTISNADKLISLPEGRRTLRDHAASGLIQDCAQSVYHYVINGAGIARVYKVDADAGAGLDWRVKQFAPTVHDVTGPFENVSARIIRERMVDHERSGRLIIGGRA